MSKSEMKFAIVGCGRIAHKHMRVLSEIEAAQVVAVCDNQPERARTFGEKYQVPWYTDYHKMLSEVDVDAITICTPSGYHARHVIDCAPYKKHIIVEKPMALRLEDADRMIEACDLNGIKLFVVKQNRYNLPVKKLREAIEHDRFGRIIMGQVRVLWMRDQAYYDQDDWRGTWALDGGVLANQASHHIDLLQWMLGPVNSVFAKTETFLNNIETEDTGVAIFRFSSGALGIVQATTCARPRDLEGSISIFGEKGSVEIGGFAVNEMRLWEFADNQPGDDDVVSTYRNNPPNVYGFGHQEFYLDTIDCILNDKRSILDGLEGRKSLELISAIYESVETGKEIFLRFEPQKCRLGESRL